MADGRLPRRVPRGVRSRAATLGPGPAGARVNRCRSPRRPPPAGGWHGEGRGRADAAGARRARRRALALLPAPRGQRPGARRGRRAGDAAARLAAPHGAGEPARPPSARGCSPSPATSSSTTGAAAGPGPRPRSPRSPSSGAAEDDATDQLLLSWVVAEALTHLSEDHRAVLLECYYRGRPVAEVARRLGVPEGTVKSRTHYALRALQARARGDGGERMSCPFAHDDAAYVLGALSPGRATRASSGTWRAATSAPARSGPSPACPACWTASTPASWSTPSSDPPLPATLLPALTREVGRARRRRTSRSPGWPRRPRRWRRSACPVVADLRRTPPRPRRVRAPARPPGAVETRAMAPVGDVPVEATLSLEQVAWGTRLLLTCTYDPDSVEYDLPARGRLPPLRPDPRRPHRAGRQLALGRRHDHAGPGRDLRRPRGHRVRARCARPTAAWCCGCVRERSGLSASRSAHPPPRRPPRTTAAVHTAQPVQTSSTPKSPTVAASTKAVSVESPKPTARNAGTQCRQVSSSTAITAPPTALSRKAGPTTSASRIPSEPQVEVHRRRHEHRCRCQDTHGHRPLRSSSSYPGERIPDRPGSACRTRRDDTATTRVGGPLGDHRELAHPAARQPRRPRAGGRPRSRSTRPAPTRRAIARPVRLEGVGERRGDQRGARWCTSRIQRTSSPRPRRARHQVRQRHRPDRVGVGHGRPLGRRQGPPSSTVSANRPPGTSAAATSPQQRPACPGRRAASPAGGRRRSGPAGSGGTSPTSKRQGGSGGPARERARRRRRSRSTPR